MVVLQTKVSVNGITGKQVTDFFINCTDSDYQKWWGGTHLEFHTVKRMANVIGSLVYFDEYIGRHRLKFKGRITGYTPGKRFECRMVRGLQLPAWFEMELQDRPDGVDIVHTVRAGYRGVGKMLDPLIRLYLSQEYEEALNQHATTEFPRLGDLLRQDHHH